MYPIFESQNDVELTMEAFIQSFPILKHVENSKAFHHNQDRLVSGYHNNRHMKLVAYTIFLMAYRRVAHNRLATMMVAALLHDNGHHGVPDSEAANIASAIDSVHIARAELSKDFPQFNWGMVCELIQASEWPHQANIKIVRADPEEVAIFRDADVLSNLTQGGAELLMDGFRRENEKRFADWPGGVNQLKAHVEFVENYQPCSKEGRAFKELLKEAAYQRWARHLHERDGGEWQSYLDALSEVK